MKPQFKFLRSRWGIAVITAVLLILFVFRPGVYRLRNRIAISIGSALGRRVAIDYVRLRLLPRPGFSLENLVIYDDPAFSAEPMIRAQDVTAAIRLRSLLRGRLEIANLSASEPSVNLVRNDAGHWNLFALIERNAQIPAAPTQKPASERRPAFPYLEATNARINFKLGQIKTSYALMNADVALWQDSENSWAARIRAEPVRTDFNLTDTGMVQINATWQRTPKLWSTPLQLAIQWRGGQLGQITKLFSGKDRGWRGGLDLTVNLAGIPEALQVSSRATINDFHRYDIVGNDNVRLAGACSGRYNALARTLAEASCEAPVGAGYVRLHGDLSMGSQPTYDATLQIEKVPVASLVPLLRHAKKRIPGDLNAAGLLNAEFRARRDAATRSSAQWTGQGSAANVRISSNGGTDQIDLNTVPLTLVAETPGATAGIRAALTGQGPVTTRLRLGPVSLAVNGSAPVQVGGWLSDAGYRFFLRGDVDLGDLFRLESVFGLPLARPAAKGAAKLDVSLYGAWQGFAPAVTAGTAQLRNVEAEMHGLNTPIEIAAAAVTITPDSVLVQKLSGRTGSTHWSGNVAAPRNCAMADAVSGNVAAGAPACVFRFDLTGDQLSAADLTEWFSANAAQRPWYRLLTSNSGNRISPLLALQAHGSLHIQRLTLKKLTATLVATQVEIDRGRITLNTLRARVLQGTHQGDWTIDLSKRGAAALPVRFRGAGTLQDISLAEVATLMKNAWITGVADANFDVQGSGNSFADLGAQSEGNLRFVMRNGSFPRLEIPAAGEPFSVHNFAGELNLKKGAVWELPSGRLESHDGIYEVRGTSSPGQGFNIVLTRNDDVAWRVSGSLARLKVSPIDRTEAKRIGGTDGQAIKP